jgi:hypothetical protein
MKKFIFITPEGLSFKPTMDSPEPDALDMEIFGFNSKVSVQDVIRDLMELSENSEGDHLVRPFTLRIENDSRKNIWVREKKYKTSIAS